MTEREETDWHWEESNLERVAFEVSKWNKDWELRRRPGLGYQLDSYWSKVLVEAMEVLEIAQRK